MEYSPSALPVQETGVIIRRSYRGGKNTNVFVCLYVSQPGDKMVACPGCALPIESRKLARSPVTLNRKWIIISCLYI